MRAETAASCRSARATTEAPAFRVEVLAPLHGRDSSHRCDQSDSDGGHAPHVTSTATILARVLRLAFAPKYAIRVVIEVALIFQRCLEAKPSAMDSDLGRGHGAISHLGGLLFRKALDIVQDERRRHPAFPISFPSSCRGAAPPCPFQPLQPPAKYPRTRSLPRSRRLDRPR